MITSSERPIATRWRQLRAAGRRALIPYLTAGFPDPSGCREAIRAAVAGGADILELGIPFSDPIADGPTIQRASARALAHGTDVPHVLALLDELQLEIPVVLFSYLNPIMSYGPARFLNEAAAVGAAALLVTDLPAGADRELEARVQASPLDLIRLVAPTTPAERVVRVLDGARGFVYVIARLGVTGAREQLDDGLRDTVARVRAATSLPVAVGFGVATAEHARRIGQLADGVVVGSALLEVLERGGPAAVHALLGDLRRALDAPSEA